MWRVGFVDRTVSPPQYPPSRTVRTACASVERADASCRLPSRLRSSRRRNAGTLPAGRGGQRATAGRIATNRVHQHLGRPSVRSAMWHGISSQLMRATPGISDSRRQAVFDVILLRVAEAAVDENGAFACVAARVRSETVGRIGGGGAALLAVVESSRLAYDEGRRLEPHPVHRQRMLDRLVLADGAIEPQCAHLHKRLANASGGQDFAAVSTKCVCVAGWPESHARKRVCGVRLRA